MEMTGMLDDDLREEAENLFYRWAESREGLARIDEPVYLLPGYPRQNHGRNMGCMMRSTVTLPPEAHEKRRNVQLLW